MIGAIGNKIIFEVSDKKVLTPQSVSREVSGNWAAHERIGQKPVSEFLGANLQTMELTIILDANHGVKPRAVLNAITAMVETGVAEYFVIGAAPVSKYPWKILTASETWDRILSKGELLKATLTLSLEEYL